MPNANTLSFHVNLLDSLEKVINYTEINYSIFKELGIYLQRYEAIEDDYSKKISALCNERSAAFRLVETGNPDTSRSMTQAVNALLGSLGTSCDQRTSIYHSRLREMQIMLNGHKNELESSKKTMKDRGEKLLKDLRSTYANEQKSRAAYQQKYLEWESALVTLDKEAQGKRKNDTITKLYDKEQSLKKKLAAAKSESIEATTAFNNLQDRFFRVDLPELLKKYQSLNENLGEQIELVVKTLSEAETVYVAKRSGEMPDFHRITHQFKISEDIQSFIQKNQNVGFMVPGPLPFMEFEVSDEVRDVIKHNMAVKGVAPGGGSEVDPTSTSIAAVPPWKQRSTQANSVVDGHNTTQGVSNGSNASSPHGANPLSNLSSPSTPHSTPPQPSLLKKASTFDVSSPSSQAGSQRNFKGHDEHLDSHEEINGVADKPIGFPIKLSGTLPRYQPKPAAAATGLPLNLPPPLTAKPSSTPPPDNNAPPPLTKKPTLGSNVTPNSNGIASNNSGTTPSATQGSQSTRVNRSESHGSSVNSTIFKSPSPPVSKQKAVALYDCVGTSPDELDFVAGEDLLILDDSNAEWWWAKDAGGREGHVPANYVRKVEKSSGNTSPTPSLGAGASTQDEQRVPCDFSKAPHLIAKCVKYLIDRGLQTEGLFRVPGSLSTIKQLKHRFDTDPDADLEDVYDPLTVAGLIKYHVKEDRDFIFSKALQASLSDAIRLEDDIARLNSIRRCLLPLPTHHRATLGLLFTLFARIAENADTNRMTTHNLAMVFGLSLFHNMGVNSANGLLEYMLINRRKILAID